MRTTPRIDVITIFPDFFQGPLTVSMVKRAVEKKAVTLKVHDLRKWAKDRHHMVDDVPYGGGAGMVMKPEPWAKAIRAVKRGRKNVKVLYLSPQGARFDHAKALELSKEKSLILLCGHYEGLDERVLDALVDEEISLGDFVMTGGEPAAAAMIDTLVRFYPGVVGDRQSVENDSFFDGLLDHPHYTRPRKFEGREVPEELLSGNHAKIKQWRRREALRSTLQKRPDLLEKARLSDQDRKFLDEMKSGRDRRVGTELEEKK